MRALLMTLGSLVLTFSVIGNAYYQKKQFYPSVVYITKSNPSMAIIYVQAFVLVALMGKLMRKVFFGQLRAAELEHLIERSWYAVTETCLAFTVFRDDFSPKFVGLFTLLLFLKCFHWLAEDRVDYMERSPVISWLFHTRVISLLIVLGSLDVHLVNLAYYSTLTKGASVQLVFGFEYAILLTIVVNILIKYILHTIDLHSENPWENKAVFLLYTELVMGLIKGLLYIAFMLIMIKIHTFPLFAIRPMYLTIRSFKKALNDVIMSRRAIRNMNTLYPDATPEELASADNVCIICREEMTTQSKKLPCNHIFHASCLRSWFQRQQTCPTCRMDILRPSGTESQQQHHPPADQAAAAAAAAAAQAQNAQQFGPPPGLYPGAFLMWPPLLQPPAQGVGAAQPNLQAATDATGSGQPTGGTADGSVPNMQPPNGNPLPFLVPPFPFMPFTVPPPLPPVNFAGLSEEELRAMEGEERQHVETRIQCLRNIQTLLDAAVVQMQQYTAIVAGMRSSGPGRPFEATSPESTVRHSAGDIASPRAAGEEVPPTSPVKHSESGEASVLEQEPCTSTSGATGGTAAAGSSEPESSEDAETIRRRRLQKFSESSNTP